MKLPDRVLEPSERIGEILFGLIMVLTVTGATSVVTADRTEIQTMLIAALGCNVAWGIIDAGMYLMARLAEQGSNALLLREVRGTADRERAHRTIADALPPLLASIFQPSQLDLICEGIRRLPESETRPRLTGRDWLGALGVLYPCNSVDLSGRDSLSHLRQCANGAASLQRYRRGVLVFLRSDFCALCRPSALANGAYNGSRRRRAGGNCDRPGRMKSANAARGDRIND
ncbi:MAG: hypothetical protein WBL48_21605 [Pseudolabrys sp.]